MMMPRGFDGFAFVPTPRGGFWRVSAWHEPFDPPSPAPPVGTPAHDDDGHRFDDPDGRHRTLYCATAPEGALGECLGDFAFNAAAVRRIEAFLVSEPDEGFDEDYQRPLSAEDVEAFGWKLARAPADPTRECIDVNHWRTYLAVARELVGIGAEYGLRRIDRGTLLDERRKLTRRLAGVWRAAATDPASGQLRAAGLRFESRLPPAWECWALWEPLALDAAQAEIEPVTVHTPALRLAAGMLGVGLADG